MKNKIVMTAFLAVMMTGIAGAAENTYFLTHSNINDINDNVKVRVIIDDSTGTISVQLIESPSGFTPLGIDQFYYNLDNKIVNVQDPLGTWDFLNMGNSHISAFGDFLSKQSKASEGRHDGGVSEPIVFTLEKPVPLNIPQNDDTHKATIAVHVRFAGGCTGFVSDGFPTPGSTRSCSTTQIPEFPTIALPLVVTGLLLLLFYHRRRKIT